ncbi:efflux RND transporter periplasmic adaptor subunit [Lacimicrobium alkaliphilum]|uniref:RND transporter n=1 Tax=Lacimicrobium alkaliphilum TaxID=1526571 RepID=A0A0U3B3V3_9ALTE|nr:efflux RND transporter periplasmic adaptor subunit [Lacimicrobium alkaliphilum]ALS99880.1 RND transporter [Lacimicrobium alkaliphilum]
MLKKMSFSPVIIAIVLAIVLVIWLLSGDDYSARTEAPAEQQPPKAQLTSVETRWSEARPYAATTIAQGQVLPWRLVEIKSQQSGRIEQLYKQQGEPVQQGEKLLRISDEGRSALLAKAQANLKLRQSELKSARSLGESQFSSATELTRLESELAKAEAELHNARLNLSQTEPGAPFDGVVDRRHIEVGDLVQSGTALMQLVQLDKLKVTAQIPQQHVSELEIGQSATLTLLDGRKLEGTLSFISAAADTSTRSFYIEITAPNPQHWRIAGGSATVEIALGSVPAHYVSPALLSLDDSGNLGLSVVNQQKQVEFYPVSILSATNDGAWVSGLPERAQIIIQGAGFVQPGDVVRTTEVSS